MPCDKIGVPEYLHWNEKIKLNDADFLSNHLLYRLTNGDNPIEFPLGTYTALSCKWSFLIQEQDVITAERDFVADSFKYAIVNDIRCYSLNREKEYNGINTWHRLSCVLNHDPKECDYSHAEVLIKHDIHSDKEATVLLHSFLYTYALWQTNKTVLQRKSYKEMCKDYRRDIIKLFCYPSLG